MLDQEKKDFIKSLIPKAILKAVTDEAENAITHHQMGKNTISIYKFPFYVGREMRANIVNGHLQIMERRMKAHHSHHNDLYLKDMGDLLQISRKHFAIKSTNGEYILQDLGSACGMMVGDVHIGGMDKGGSFIIKDGDIIGIGKETTPYFFKFIVLDGNLEL